MNSYSKKHNTDMHMQQFAKAVDRFICCLCRCNRETSCRIEPHMAEQNLVHCPKSMFFPDKKKSTKPLWEIEEKGLCNW